MTKMFRWPYEVKRTTTAEIGFFTLDPEWQKVRLSMKGVTTHRKLELLRAYRNECIAKRGGILPRANTVQIDNYINALKRGGQLNGLNEVVK